MAVTPRLSLLPRPKIRRWVWGLCIALVALGLVVRALLIAFVQDDVERTVEHTASCPRFLLLGTGRRCLLLPAGEWHGVERGGERPHAYPEEEGMERVYIRGSIVTGPVEIRASGQRCALRRWKLEIDQKWMRLNTLPLPVKVSRALGVTCSPSNRFVAFSDHSGSHWIVYLADWRARTVRQIASHPRDPHLRGVPGLACDDAGVVYAWYEGWDYDAYRPVPVTRYLPNGADAPVGAFNEVQTNTAGAFGVIYRQNRGRVEVNITNLSHLRAAGVQYTLPLYSPTEALLNLNPITYISAFSSDDGRYWVVEAFVRKGAFPVGGSPVLAVWGWGARAPACVTRDFSLRYFGPISLQVTEGRRPGTAAPSVP